MMKIFMIFLGGFYPSFTGFFDVIKKTEMNMNPISAYICSPFLGRFRPPDPPNARRIRFCLSSIHHILRLCSFSEVFKTIIRWVTVNVVNQVLWPLTCSNGPSNSVGFVKFSMNADQNAPIRAFAPRNIPNFNSLAGFYFPSQKTSVWVVGEHCRNLFDGKHSQYLPEFPRSCNRR